MLRIKHIPLLVFVLIFINCAKDEPVDSVEAIPLVSAIEIGNSELPYIKIKTISTVLNEPKIGGEMEIYINKKGF